MDVGERTRWHDTSQASRPAVKLDVKRSRREEALSDDFEFDARRKAYCDKEEYEFDAIDKLSTKIYFMNAEPAELKEDNVRLENGLDDVRGLRDALQAAPSASRGAPAPSAGSELGAGPLDLESLQHFKRKWQWHRQRRHDATSPRRRNGNGKGNGNGNGNGSGNGNVATTPRRQDAKTPQRQRQRQRQRQWQWQRQRRHDATTPRRQDAKTPRRHDAEAPEHGRVGARSTTSTSSSSTSTSRCAFSLSGRFCTISRVRAGGRAAWPAELAALRAAPSAPVGTSAPSAGSELGAGPLGRQS
jgi:hypothetical protein